MDTQTTARTYDELTQRLLDSADELSEVLEALRDLPDCSAPYLKWKVHRAYVATREAAEFGHGRAKYLDPTGALRA